MGYLELAYDRLENQGRLEKADQACWKSQSTP